MEDGKITTGQAASLPFVEQTVYHGRPADETGRLLKEIRTYDILDKLKIPFTRVDHQEIATVEACGELDKLLKSPLCKNLFLCNSQKTRFYLLMMPGRKRFITKEFCRQIGSPRLSFAPEEYMVKYLDITPGSVSVLGLANDTKKQVQLVIDRDILQGETVGCHPCINTSSLCIAMKDLLEKFLPYVEHDYIEVDLPWE